MAVVQETYPNFHEAWVNGQVATTETCDIDSVISSDDDPIPFGRALYKDDAGGASPKHVKLGVKAANLFRGLSVMDERLPATNGPNYHKGDEVSCLVRGSLAVRVESAVKDGQDVTANQDTGQLSSAAAGASQFLIPGARFMSDAAAGGIAVVRLAGALPTQ